MQGRIRQVGIRLSLNKEETMNFHVGVIAGDGIGPEVVAEAKKVLETV
jgi:isocitrate dehydrogenase